MRQTRPMSAGYEDARPYSSAGLKTLVLTRQTDSMSGGYVRHSKRGFYAACRADSGQPQQVFIPVTGLLQQPSDAGVLKQLPLAVRWVTLGLGKLLNRSRALLAACCTAGQLAKQRCCLQPILLAPSVLCKAPYFEVARRGTKAPVGRGWGPGPQAQPCRLPRLAAMLSLSCSTRWVGTMRAAALLTLRFNARRRPSSTKSR